MTLFTLDGYMDGSVERHVTQFCEQLTAETGKPVQKVNATWTIPTWNGLVTDDNSVIKRAYPACCFKPDNSEDVLAACRIAAQHGLKISPRGSGHHYGGVSLVDGGVLLDLRELRGVQVDPASFTARVGPAATCRDLRGALAPLQLHFPLPHLSDVGLAGYILGGGNGWGVRQYGAAADNVQEMEVVLLGGAAAGDGGSSGGDAERVAGNPDAYAEPDSSSLPGPGSDAQAGTGCRLVRVSSETDPELFWGLRGGGAFLGVVTEFILRLHPFKVPCLPLITATYPLTLFERLADFFREFHCANPTCVEASMSVTGAPADREREGGTGGDGRGDGSVPAVVVLACTAFAAPGSPEVEASYARLRALLPGARLSLQEGPVPYDEAMSVLDPAWSWPGLRMYGHGAFIAVQSLRADGDLVSALGRAARGITSCRSILLVCPAAPRKPGCTRAGHSDSDSGAATLAKTTVATGATAGALGFRDSFYVGVYGMWTRSKEGPAADGDTAHVGWVRSCASSLEAHLLGLYVNEVMHDQPAQVRQSYEEETIARLQALKRRVDPLGLLRAL